MKLAHAGVTLKVSAQPGINTRSVTRLGTRFRTGNFLAYFLSVVLVGSATVKLLQVHPVVSRMAVLGFDGAKLTLIAILEIASALLFAYKHTRSFGLLMVSAYLGGAIATHVGHDQLPTQPAIVLALIWLAAWLRHPGMLPARDLNS